MIGKTATFALAALLCGCTDDNAVSSSADSRSLSHPNGLAIKAPLSTTVEQATHGFTLRDIASSKGRYPIEATVEVVTGLKRQLTLTKTKKFGSRSVSYQIDETGSGSGGAVYRLRVLWIIDREAILFEQSEQVEFPLPKFELCWELVKTTSLKPVAN